MVNVTHFSVMHGGPVIVGDLAGHGPGSPRRGVSQGMTWGEGGVCIIVTSCSGRPVWLLPLFWPTQYKCTRWVRIRWHLHHNVGRSGKSAVVEEAFVVAVKRRTMECTLFSHRRFLPQLSCFLSCPSEKKICLFLRLRWQHLRWTCDQTFTSPRKQLFRRLCSCPSSSIRPA